MSQVCHGERQELVNGGCNVTGAITVVTHRGKGWLVGGGGGWMRVGVGDCRN